MRLLLMFMFFVQAIHAEISAQSGNKLICPSLVGTNTKHNWEVKKFLGLWYGDELYSHVENQLFNDTCLQLEITEVNDMNDEVSFSKPVDPYNFRLALRHLRLDFFYQSQFAYTQAVTLNMTKIGIWQGDDVTIQVLKSNDIQMMLTICEPKTSKLSTILLSRNPTTVEPNAINKLIMQIRNLTIYSTENLETNCSFGQIESRVHSAGIIMNVSFITTAFFITTMCLFS